MASITELPTTISSTIEVLESKGWRWDAYTWRPTLCQASLKFLKDGDLIVVLQRDFQTLELVQHKEECGMQYVYTYNGEYEQKYTRGGYWATFLSEFA